MFGISKSIRITDKSDPPALKKCVFFKNSRASSPSFVALTVQPALRSWFTSTFWLMRLSSTMWIVRELGVKTAARMLSRRVRAEGLGDRRWTVFLVEGISERIGWGEPCSLGGKHR